MLQRQWPICTPRYLGGYLAYDFCKHLRSTKCKCRWCTATSSRTTCYWTPTDGGSFVILASHACVTARPCQPPLAALQAPLPTWRPRSFKPGREPDRRWMCMPLGCCCGKWSLEGSPGQTSVAQWRYVDFCLSTPCHMCHVCMQIIYAVGVLQQRPPIPPGLPEGLASLMQRCWGQVPASRPTFVEVFKMLQKTTAMLQQQE